MRLDIMCEKCQKKIGSAKLHVALNGSEARVLPNAEDVEYFKARHEGKCRPKDLPKHEVLEHLHKYVVLEHIQGLDKGFRFWSLNSPDCELLNTGERVYEKVLETDDPKEAERAATRINFPKVLS